MVSSYCHGQILTYLKMLFATSQKEIFSLPLMSMNSIKRENCQRIPSGDIADEKTYSLIGRK